MNYQTDSADAIIARGKRHAREFAKRDPEGYYAFLCGYLKGAVKTLVDNRDKDRVRGAA